VFYQKLKIKKLLVVLSLFTQIYSIDKTEFVETPRVFLVDIGQTLISVNKTKSMRYMLSYDTLLYCLKSFFTGNFKITSYMKDFYLNSLAKIPSPLQPPDYRVIGFNNKPMAALQQDWFCGRITENECRCIVDKFVESNKEQFSTSIERNLFKNIFHFNFNSELFINYLEYTNLINVLEKLYKSVDDQNKRKNICIIISNQPTEIITLMKIKFPKIFQFTDAQVFSCYEGFVKPHVALFEKCLSICPDNCHKDCIFIDDEDGNINAVKKLKSFRL